MEPSVCAGAVLMSPLAVDDVFRQQTVPEVQELLRQLQLQQANDAEEVRTLIGVRYLSFLEGLPEISHMQRAAEEVLDDAKAFGVNLRCLATAVDDVSLNGAQPSEEAYLQYERQQQRVLHELPLQHSTPLDDFLFASAMNSPSPASADTLGQRDDKQMALSSASSRPFPHLRERDVTPEQPGALRYVQQQLLLLPSRIWEALRRHQFLEAIRLILIEGRRQADAAKAAVHQHELQQPPLQKQHQRQWVRQREGCLALARQTALAASSLVSSVRALALRHLASADLPLSFAADAAAAATLIYLLDVRRSSGGPSEAMDDEVATSAAKWLLGVFFSARGEALEAQSLPAGKGWEPPVVDDVTGRSVYGGAACREGEWDAAVDAAESLLVSFASSLEAAAVLFFPSGGAALVEGAASEGPLGNGFAAVRAAEVALGSLTSLDFVHVAWALRALPRVFGCLAAQFCDSRRSTPGWRRCCENHDLCARARLMAFAGQWRRPLETRLSRLFAEGSWRSLKDIRSFWVTLVQRLQARRPRWPLTSGASVFVVGSPACVDAKSFGGLVGVCLEAPGDIYGYQGTVQLLRVLGTACARACEFIAGSRVKDLPLLALGKGECEPLGISKTLESKDQPWQWTFQESLLLHLQDVSALFGRPEDPENTRAALPLRAAVVASLLQSLAECAAPLRTSAYAVADTAGGEEPRMHTQRLCEEDMDMSLMRQARRVEWLSGACRGEETARQDDDETAECERQLGALLAEWMSGAQRSIEHHQPHLANLYINEQAEADANEEAKNASMVSAAEAAAQSLYPCLCLSSLVGYAVGFWPFVRAAVKELETSWQWQRTTPAAPSLDSDGSSVEISGGAMSFLLELSRRFAVTSQNLKLQDPCTAPLFCFALKAVAAEEVAAAAAAAFAEVTQQQQRQHVFQCPGFPVHIHLLQLLVDCELLATALDAPPPLTEAQKPSAVSDELPLPLRKAVRAGLEGRGSAETLREAAREARKWLDPSLEGKLERCIASSVAASSSLLFASLHSKGLQVEALSRGVAGGEGQGIKPTPTLLGPRERAPLLPITPLPAFASLLGHSSDKPEALAPQAPAIDVETQEEMQQQPKEPVKQLHRLRLDDAVDSVSRGLQSWLKRGSSETDEPGLFPLKGSEACTSSGAAKGAAVVSAAGSGLAGAWAKQMEQMSALIGQRVESVQSRASPSIALRLGQRNGSGVGGNLPASPATMTADQRFS